MRNLHFVFLTVLLLVTLSGAFAQEVPVRANLVHNGSFENLKNTWLDTNCNYMSLLAGSAAIPGWTVTHGTTNEIVWAMTLTCDGHTAADRTFFLDLTGFGGDSPNGGVQQRVRDLTIGQEYAFSVDVITSGSLPLVSVDGAPVTLTPGKPFIKGSDSWTPERGTFTAQSSNPLLTIENQQPGQQILFVDNVVVAVR